MKSRLALVIALFVLSSAANAEVRLHSGPTGPALDVQPVAQGVWTPTRVPDIYTVNPQGDLIGDGFPAHRSAGGHLVAAWQRPSRSAVVVLSVTSPTTSTMVEVATVDAVGMPIVTSLNSGFLVTWQSGTATPEVKAVVADDGGVSPPISILTGRMLGVYAVGDAAHVVAFDAPGRALNIVTFPTAYVPNPIPVPVTRVPLFRTIGAVPLEATPPPEFVTSPATWQPCVDERGTDVLVAWQAGRSVLGRVILNANGVEGAGEFFRGPNGSCQALLNAAARN